jgi:hypothetical protein
MGRCHSAAGHRTPHRHHPIGRSRTCRRIEMWCHDSGWPVCQSRTPVAALVRHLCATLRVTSLETERQRDISARAYTHNGQGQAPREISSTGRERCEERMRRWTIEEWVDRSPVR